MSVRVIGVDGELGVYVGYVLFFIFIKLGMVKYMLEDGKEEFIYVLGGFFEV